MMRAGLALLGMTDIHRMNGLKVLLNSLINGLAVVTFLVAGLVEQRLAGMMVVGAVAGGLLGAGLARRVKQEWVRAFVVGVGWAMTGWFFLRALG
jgi:uncharacterized membrane protein YfcA